MSGRILVTGASGFVMSQTLGPLLAAGFEVIAVSRRPVDHAGVTWVRLDMMDATAVVSALHTLQPSCVLHGAWTVEHGRFWTAPDNLDWAALTIRLARACAEAGTTRFVGIGTCAEYDWSDGGMGFRCEDDACMSVTLYGAAKDATRRMLAAWFAQQGIGFAWARLFNLFGPAEAPGRFVRSITDALKRGEPAICRKGGLLRDVMPVTEAGAALAALAASHVAGPVNIGSGEARTLGGIAQFLAERSGRPDLAQIGTEPPSPSEPERMLPDLTRLRHEVRFAGSGANGLDDALAAMLR